MVSCSLADSPGSGTVWASTSWEAFRGLVGGQSYGLQGSNISGAGIPCPVLQSSTGCDAHLAFQSPRGTNAQCSLPGVPPHHWKESEIVSGYCLACPQDSGLLLRPPKAFFPGPRCSFMVSITEPDPSGSHCPGQSVSITGGSSEIHSFYCPLSFSFQHHIFLLLERPGRIRAFYH